MHLTRTIEPNVAFCCQLARLIAQRTTDAIAHKITTTTRIVFWNGPKGIDEAIKASALYSLTILRMVCSP